MRNDFIEIERNYETLPEGGNIVRVLITSGLHLGPPVLKLVQSIITRKLSEELHSDHRSYSRQARRIVASEEVRQPDECPAVQAKLTREIGEEETLDGLGLVEHVFVHALGTEEKDIRIVCNYTVDQSEFDKRGALRFCFHGCRDVGNAEKAQHCLQSSNLRVMS